MGMFDTIEIHRKLPWAVVDGVEAKDIKDLHGALHDCGERKIVCSTS